MTTSFEAELREQARWRLQPGFEGFRDHHDLVPNEFLEAAEREAMVGAALRKIVGFAGEHVPFYVDALRKSGVKADEIDSVGKLPLLPVVTKAQVAEAPDRFRPDSLPPGEQFGALLSSTGTTGIPLKVPHTLHSRTRSSLLRQRQMRWFRWDPKGKVAYILAPTDMIRQRDGHRLGPGDRRRMKGWRALQQWIRTGPAVLLSHHTPLEAQIEFLLDEKPDYLTAHSAQLEHLALTVGDSDARVSFRGAQATAQQFTSDMRALVEGTFGCPAMQDYGLNEVGLVAARCPEGERYHVHIEHALVEVVDEEGQPCPPGRQGRLLVTALNNAAMPLLRYDCDDLATLAGSEHCPCGRTLPAFVDLVGRYRRLASLPPGAWKRFTVFTLTLHRCPPELRRPLRQYQLHHSLDGNFEARLVVARPLGPAFFERLSSQWKAQVGDDGPTLTFRVVDEIPRPPGGKFQDFTSDFAPFPTAT